MDRLEVRHLGRVPYAEAYDLQRALLRSERDHVLILEHPATITLGRRAWARPTGGLRHRVARR